MSYQDIICDRRGQSMWIYLNRPKDMNSISSTMMLEIQDVLTQTRVDDAIKVIVLVGKGAAFCAGADLKEVNAYLSQEASAAPDFFSIVEQTFSLLTNYPKPLIAALNGITLAGGLELAMTADLIIAAESAKIGDAHSNFGLLPGAGSSVLLPRKIGINRAKYLLFTGEFISAAKMKEFGLVNQTVPDDKLETTVEKLVERLSAKSPLVLKNMKQLIQSGMEQPLEIALKTELLTLRNHLLSYDSAEGLKAFMEKRRPEFKGF